jgi:hypothetical protein
MDKMKSNMQQQNPDNVLLEMELALIRKQTEPEGTMAVFPVFVGTNPIVYLFRLLPPSLPSSRSYLSPILSLFTAFLHF